MSNSVPIKAHPHAVPRFDERVSQRLDFPEMEACPEQKSIDPQVDRFGRASMKEMTDPQQRAVTDLYERYGKILRSVVGQVLKEDAQVEDLVQEVFLHLYREAVRETFDREIGARLLYLSK